MTAGAVRTLAVVALWIAVAHAEPEPSTSELLRQGNTAAASPDRGAVGITVHF